MVVGLPPSKMSALLAFKRNRWWWCGRATTFRKRARMLVFESGNGGGVWDHAPSKTSIHAHFRGWMVVVVGLPRVLPPSKTSTLLTIKRNGWWWWIESYHLRKRARMLVFEGGDGGGVGKDHATSKTSIRGSFSRVGMVLLARSNRPRK